MNTFKYIYMKSFALLILSLLSLLFFSCTSKQKQDISYIERLPSDDQRCQPGAAVGNSWICIPQPPGMLEVKDSTLLDSLFANENQLVMAYFVDSAEWRALADTATEGYIETIILFAATSAADVIFDDKKLEVWESELTKTMLDGVWLWTIDRVENIGIHYELGDNFLVERFRAAPLARGILSVAHLIDDQGHPEFFVQVNGLMVIRNRMISMTYSYVYTGKASLTRAKEASSRMMQLVLAANGEGE